MLLFPYCAGLEAIEENVDYYQVSYNNKTEYIKDNILGEICKFLAKSLKYFKGFTNSTSVKMLTMLYNLHIQKIKN